jgi:alkylhydroperoxidase family enzyme
VTGESRIPRLSADEARAAAEAVGVPGMMADLSVFQVLLRHPALARALNEPLSLLLWRGTLDARLRELVIMRIGWATGSVYEWTQHWWVARGLGVTAEDLIGVRQWRAYDGFGAAEQAVLAATDEVLGRGAVTAGTWAECERHVGGPEQLLELVAAIGNWRMFSTLLRSLAVPLEDGTDPWPPDGLAPAIDGPYWLHQRNQW